MHLLSVVCLLSVLVACQCRGGRGGGGGGGRGSSGARGSSMGRGSSGGKSSSFGKSSFGGASRSYSAPRGGSSQFNRGFSSSGIGSQTSARQFRTQLAGQQSYRRGGMGAGTGFATGYLLASSSPMMMYHRPYYWGSSYYVSSPSTHMCKMPVQDLEQGEFGGSNATSLDDGSSDDNNTLTVQFEDGTRPTEMVWPCPLSDDCCGVECCPAAQDEGTGTVLLMVALIGIFAFLMKSNVLNKIGETCRNTCKKDNRPKDISMEERRREQYHAPSNA